MAKEPKFQDHEKQALYTCLKGFVITTHALAVELENAGQTKMSVMLEEIFREDMTRSALLISRLHEKANAA